MTTKPWNTVVVNFRLKAFFCNCRKPKQNKADLPSVTILNFMPMLNFPLRSRFLTWGGGGGRELKICLTCLGGTLRILSNMGGTLRILSYMGYITDFVSHGWYIADFASHGGTVTDFVSHRGTLRILRIFSHIGVHNGFCFARVREPTNPWKYRRKLSLRTLHSLMLPW